MKNERITGLGVFLSVKLRKLRENLGVRQIPDEGEEGREEEKKRKGRQYDRNDEENKNEI